MGAIARVTTTSSTAVMRMGGAGAHDELTLGNIDGPFPTGQRPYCTGGNKHCRQADDELHNELVHVLSLLILASPVSRRRSYDWVPEIQASSGHAKCRFQAGIHLPHR